MKWNTISSINDPTMYKSAREISEPDFIQCLRNNGFTNVRQSTKHEDVHHADIFATKNGNEYIFDVKDLSKKNVYSRRYSLSNHEVEDAKSIINREKYNRHFLALRLYAFGKPTGEYLIVKTMHAVSIAEQRGKTENEKNACYWLIDIDKIKRQFKTITYRS